MPVEGSTWWINAFTPDGTPIFSHRVRPDAGRQGRRPCSFRVPRSHLLGAGLEPSGGRSSWPSAWEQEGPPVRTTPPMVSNRWNVQWEPATLKLPATAQPR